MNTRRKITLVLALLLLYMAPCSIAFGEEVVITAEDVKTGELQNVKFEADTKEAVEDKISEFKEMATKESYDYNFSYNTVEKDSSSLDSESVN